MLFACSLALYSFCNLFKWDKVTPIHMTECVVGAKDIHIRFWDAQTIFYGEEKHPRIPTHAVLCALASEKLFSIFV